ncbi:MAG: hypothetical protein LQ350_007807 [Teloschistes chrysophthalmus]|nr:MAG: hypothetical protein LQ350_007807 [Niorma chrysophthalma]
MTQTTAPTTLTPHTPFIPRGPVTATLNFYNPPPSGAKPYNYVEQPPPGEPQRNFSDHPHSTTINDIRGREHLFTLDTHAFAALQNIPSKVPPQAFLSPNANTDEAIKSLYYPEVERLLLAHTGAKSVLIFDHTVRRADPSAQRSPVTRVHIDQTARSAAQRVELHLPPSSSSPSSLDETHKNQRVRIINVWRPLSPTHITAYPLAFASSPSVPNEAITPVEHRYPTRTGETAAVAWTEEQEWWYWSGMREGERVVLQCCDSEKGARVPHAAFVDPRSEEGVGRESVEVRALVFG